MQFLVKKGINCAPRLLKIISTGGKLQIENISDKTQFYILPKIFFFKDHTVEVSFKGEEINNSSSKLLLVDRKKKILLSVSLNERIFSSTLESRMAIGVLRIPAFGKVILSKLEVHAGSSQASLYFKNFLGDTLLVTPVYPSLSNKYSGGFVHTRAKAYIKAGIKLDIALITDTDRIATYTYEGVKVFQGSYYNLRELLQQKKYKRILIHFFDQRYASVLDSCDLTGTKLYFYLHGAETLYWDWNKITSPYFNQRDILSEELVKDFRNRDMVIKKYNENPNVMWVFVTPWTKKRSEELVQVKYKNSNCIPCWVDENLFKEEEKDPELRKRIFVLRKFDNINTYSIDTVVRTILELSRRKLFSDLEFNIYGDGLLFDYLLAPIKQFKNVILHKTFLTHEEIKRVHESNGIALFPTRFDSQAVSSCEAASSGCVVISSFNPGVEQYIPRKLGTLCNPENYLEYADLIEKFYYDKELFTRVSREMPKIVRKKCSFRATIGKELEIFNNEEYVELKYEEWDKKPLLTIVIPSYNVEQYLRHTVYSLIHQRNRNKIEIIIVNDGSKDRTAEIGEELMKQYNNTKNKLVRVINKINGGHGSTINVGIKEAKGEYLKVVDGDDTVDSFEFAKLIDLLEYESSDIILTDYVEDYAQVGRCNLMKLYNFLSPGVEYNFEDLCYEGYGFDRWGPILSTSTYRTQMLQDAGFSLSEKMFYVDMELNTYIALYAQTIKYYPLSLYRYLLGNQGQSVSRQSYTRNYKHHENVTIKMLEILFSHREISRNRNEYIKNKLIVPMIITQYDIIIKYVKTIEAFRSFDKRLKKFKDYYYDNRIATKRIKFHRKSRGIFIKLEKI